MKRSLTDSYMQAIKVEDTLRELKIMTFESALQKGWKTLKNFYEKLKIKLAFDKAKAYRNAFLVLSKKIDDMKNLEILPKVCFDEFFNEAEHGNEFTNKSLNELKFVFYELKGIEKSISSLTRKVELCTERVGLYKGDMNSMLNEVEKEKNGLKMKLDEMKMLNKEIIEYENRLKFWSEIHVPDILIRDNTRIREKFENSVMCYEEALTKYSEIISKTNEKHQSIEKASKKLSSLNISIAECNKSFQEKSLQMRNQEEKYLAIENDIQNLQSCTEQKVILREQLKEKNECRLMENEDLLGNLLIIFDKVLLKKSQIASLSKQFDEIKKPSEIEIYNRCRKFKGRFDKLRKLRIKKIEDMIEKEYREKV